jgi:hypothetical protein
VPLSRAKGATDLHPTFKTTDTRDAGVVVPLPALQLANKAIVAFPEIGHELGVLVLTILPENNESVGR